MNTPLWNTILAYDLDQPPSEYTFSLRLAKEHYWTEAFTEQAILEYKKFMFLAATSDNMVSPSRVIDAVWHQHLTYSRSYQEFCGILGKHIQHIPSNRNASDNVKFREARERTTQLYEDAFGKAPDEIWKYTGMFESLNLPKGKYKIRTTILFGILGFGLMIVPTYFALNDIIVKINNPYFLYGYVAMAVATMLLLSLYNRQVLRNTVLHFSNKSFVWNLKPAELVYMKRYRIEQVVHGVVNQLFMRKAIVAEGDSFKVVTEDARTPAEWTVLDSLKRSKDTPLYKLSKRLAEKAAFSNIAGSMDAFRKYFVKSSAFARLFYTNFVALALVLIIGTTRLLTGVMRDRPVTLIVIVLVVTFFAFVTFLFNLSMQLQTSIVPSLYKQKIKSDEQQYAGQPEWQYFLLGSAMLAPAIATMARPPSSDSDTWSSTSSDSSGCGSSCGSSCGGCGGGD